MSNSDSQANGNFNSQRSMPPSMPDIGLPRAPDVALVAIDALRSISSESAKGIAALERLLRSSEPLLRARSHQPESGGPPLEQLLSAVHARLGIDHDLQGTRNRLAPALLRKGDQDDGEPHPHEPKPSPKPTGPVTSAGLGAYPTQPPTFAEAFWWGFHIVIPHEAMEWLDWAFGANLFADAAALGAVLGPAIAAASAVPIAGWALAGVFLYLMATWGLCHAVDKGNGIYLSMLWVAPGIFVPTTR